MFEAYAARLDDHQVRFRIAGAEVAAGPGNQIIQR